MYIPEICCKKYISIKMLIIHLVQTLPKRHGNVEPIQNKVLTHGPHIQWIFIVLSGTVVDSHYKCQEKATSNARGYRKGKNKELWGTKKRHLMGGKGQGRLPGVRPVCTESWDMESGSRFIINTCLHILLNKIMFMKTFCKLPNPVELQDYFSVISFNVISKLSCK